MFLDKVISWAFHILFFLTPLFFTPFNSELFEYNKMVLVYGLTIIIVSAWLIKMVYRKSFAVNRTPLDIPILLFLGSQMLSTIFSIDPHTSIWGYYSRSNGGLLSIISYIFLYYAFVSNISREQVFGFLKTVLISGFLVSLYAIPEHFGTSPSCLILVQRFSADCWVQDVQARVFATLGQPNWLGAYLAMLIFPAIYFLLQAKTLKSKLFYYFLLFTFYLAFTFTYSRGATLGLLAGLGVFIVLYMLRLVTWGPVGAVSRPTSSARVGPPSSVNRVDLRAGAETPLHRHPFVIFLSILLGFFIINLTFGSALTGDFRLWKKNAPPPRPGISITTTAPTGTTQLETEGTETGKIRLIVWKGALDIFKAYPVFGSGVETFAYSYYNFRPLEHNFVSEWDFLYNKAHNEYLNYLATTGLVGFGGYLSVILVFITWIILKILNSKFLIFNENLKLKIKNYQQSLSSEQSLILVALFAGYASYLVQNFFSFSVVVIALLFYMIPAFVFALFSPAKAETPRKVNSASIPYALHATLYRRKIYTTGSLIGTIFILVFIALSLEFMLITYWIADTFYRKGNDYMELGNSGRAYNFLSDAVNLNRGEPLYLSDLGFAASAASVIIQTEDSETSAKLKNEAILSTEQALKMSPRNISLYRTAVRTYYNLSLIDPGFEQKTIEVLDKTISLAPTDAKLYYNKALVLSQTGKLEEGIKTFKKTLELRPNYWEAYLGLGTIYQELTRYDESKKAYGEVLKIVPNEPETLKKLEELKNK